MDISPYHIALVGFVWVLAGAASAENPEWIYPDAGPGLIVAVDCSGSIRKNWSQVQDQLIGLVDAVPEGTRLAFIRFAENAEEFARTLDLTGTQRKLIHERILDLRADGNWTNYVPAAEQIRRSAEILGMPRLIVVISDGIADPSTGEAFAEIDALLHDSFAGQPQTSLLFLAPVEDAVAHVIDRGLVEAKLLVTATPPEILERMLPATPPEAPLTGSGDSMGSDRPAGSIEAVMIPANLAPESWAGKETPATPDQAAPNGGPGRVNPYALLLGIAAFIAIVAFITGDLNRARVLVRARSRVAHRPPKNFDLIAHWEGVQQNLGPRNSLRQLRIGTAPGCDIRLSPRNGQLGELRLRPRRGRLELHNTFKSSVTVDGRRVKASRWTVISLPAKITVSKDTTVHLTQRPRTQSTVTGPKPEETYDE